MMVDSPDLEMRGHVIDQVSRPQIDVSRTATKADLKAGMEVPGAVLAGGYYPVDRRSSRAE